MRFTEVFSIFDVVIVVDSWGKIPSGILEGNIHALGSFSECLHLKRNEENYKSQYCLAQITAKMGAGPFQTKSTDRSEIEHFRGAMAR